MFGLRCFVHQKQFSLYTYNTENTKIFNIIHSNCLYDSLKTKYQIKC